MFSVRSLAIVLILITQAKVSAIVDDSAVICTDIETETVLDFESAILATSTLGDGNDGILRFQEVGNYREGDVDTPIDLVVKQTPDTTYTAKNTANNGKNGYYGMINVKSDNGEGTFDFCFQNSINQEEVTLDKFFFSFYDMDGSPEEQIGFESISLRNDAFTDYFLSNSTELFETESNGLATFTATTPGDIYDNPDNPDNLTAEQQNRGVVFQMENTACFQVKLSVSCGGTCNGGRNFLFAGKANQIVCEPTEAPTVSPTTGLPTVSPTVSPTTGLPTVSPTVSPTTGLPTVSPTVSPTTGLPTVSPTASPTTGVPTVSPTVSATTASPTVSPTVSATTASPTVSPTTASPTVSPMDPETESPTKAPSNIPVTPQPTSPDTIAPVTFNPTFEPTSGNTESPTVSPMASPTTTSPTVSPTGPNTASPTVSPTGPNTASPTVSPTGPNTASPTVSPTGPNTASPTVSPSTFPHFLNAGGSKSQPPTKSPTGGGVKGDPHFKTWNGDRYDFHGVCDLVLVHNLGFENGLGMDINIRTKQVKQWSSVSSAVVRIGEDTFEILAEKYEDKVWLNGISNDSNNKNPTDMTISGYKIDSRSVNKQQNEYIIDLGNEEKIALYTWKSMVRVEVLEPTNNNFETSVGLMGSFKDSQWMARDGKTVFSDANDFGQEWQVLPNEPTLFHTAGDGPQAPSKCQIPSKTALRRRLVKSDVTIEEAEMACAGTFKTADFDLCVFDVMASGDKEMAGAY